MARRIRKSLTQRERQCRKVAREKALRKLVHGCWRRMRFGLIVVAGCTALAGAVWEYWQQGISRTADRTVQGVWSMTAEAGFAVRTMYLEGRSRTPLKAVNKALSIKRGQPILALPLEELRQKLEALPTVKFATVERALPDTLHVRLVERDPVAVWQHKGALSLIDDEGAVMRDLKLKHYRGLPLVIGGGAPERVGEVLALLDVEPELKRLFSAAVRVGDRRWNIHLKGGVEVRLPENGAQAAWSRLAALHREQKLLDRAIRAIDLRAADRITVRLSPSVLPSASPVSAKET